MQDYKGESRSDKQKLMTNNSSVNKQNEGGKKNLNINDRFVLKSMMPIGNFYKTYKGIDLTARKFVVIYIKPTSKQKLFSKNIKEELREKIAPPLKWSGVQKIDKNLFDIQVHGKFGPSLEQIMHTYKKKITQKTLYLLAYHLLKLIDRIDNAGYVNRSLNLKTIICGESYLKNDLFLINTFDLQRKNQQSFSPIDIKYCSVGTHLKLKTCSKDTLESMCYVLMDFYLKGNLFSNLTNQNQKSFLQAKTILKPEGIPIGILQFFQYVRYLNHGEEIKFTEWKIKFKKYLTQQQFSKPYEWVQNKPKSDQSSIKTETGKKTYMTFGNFLQGFMNINNCSQKQQEQATKEIGHQEELELEQDKHELEEGDLSEYLKINEKMLQTNSLNFNKY